MSSGCATLTGLNRNPPYDEDAAYLSMPDPREMHELPDRADE